MQENDAVTYISYACPDATIPLEYLKRKLKHVFNRDMTEDIEQACAKGYILKVRECVKLTDKGRQIGFFALSQRRPRICTEEARKAHQEAVDVFSDALWTLAYAFAREDFSDILSRHIASAKAVLRNVP